MAMSPDILHMFYHLHAAVCIDPTMVYDANQRRKYIYEDLRRIVYDHVISDRFQTALSLLFSALGTVPESQAYMRQHIIDHAKSVYYTTPPPLTALSVADDEEGDKALKNYRLMGSWTQKHDCGSTYHVPDQDCSACQRENAKLANYPFQPIERCSKACKRTYQQRLRNEIRPANVVSYLETMERLKPQFKKKPSFDGKGGKMYITLHGMSHSYGMIQRRRIDRFTWQYQYYLHVGVCKTQEIETTAKALLSLTSSI